jgi:hypothetical protein
MRVVSVVSRGLMRALSAVRVTIHVFFGGRYLSDMECTTALIENKTTSYIYINRCAAALPMSRTSTHVFIMLRQVLSLCRSEYNEEQPII